MSFQPPGHAGECLVHLGALRTLLGFDPSPLHCEQWFAGHRAGVHAAAADKIRRVKLRPEDRFHLTSRDINRALSVGVRLTLAQ